MFILILLVLIIILLVRNIVIVPQGYAVVTEFLGSYKATWQPGLHIKIPFFERIARQVNMKEVVYDSPPIQAITKDNVMLMVDSVVFYKIRENGENAKKFTYGVTNPDEAIQLLAATNLRNVIGEMALDEVLSSKDRINSYMQISLDKATDDWGIEIRRVELKTLTPSVEIQEAMEQQKKASIKKDAEILEAEGHKQADILKSEGHKASTILNAEAEKQKKILEAEAEEQGRIHKARGEAEAIRMVKEAEAEGIKSLKQAEPTQEVLALKKYDTLAKVADGQATKILIPTDLADLSKDVMVKGELFKSGISEAPVSATYSRSTASKSTSTLSGTSSYKSPARTSGNIVHSECEANRSYGSKIHSCPNDEIHNKSVAEPK